MAEVLMAQFDVYRNPSERTRRAMPLLLVVQHDSVSESSSVMVIPFAAPLKISSSSRLYPVFKVGQKEYMLLTPDMASMPRAALKEPVASLAQERNRIIAALDLLFAGS